MDLLVVLLAGHQGLTPTGCHPSDPEGFLHPPWLAQVSEFADVVNFAVPRCSTPFATLGEKALDHLAPMAVHLLRLIVEDGLLVPSKLDAAKQCHQCFFPATPCVSGFQHPEGAVGRWHRRLYFRKILAALVRCLSARVKTWESCMTQWTCQRRWALKAST